MAIKMATCSKRVIDGKTVWVVLYTLAGIQLFREADIEI